MNIISEIEGLKGEEATSALLRYLLVRSPELRESFFDLVAAKSQIGPVSTTYHFSCYLEALTEDDERDQLGRMDLILEGDDIVIGIENKLTAGFQPGQPEKYLETIKKKSEALSKYRGISSRYLIAVLAPKSRYKEITVKMETLHPQDHFVVISWEEVTENMMTLKSYCDPKASAIMGDFCDYVHQSGSFISNFAKLVPHFKNSFAPRGHAWQVELVQKLWYLVPNPGARLSAGDTWAGYYFGKELKTPSGADYYGWLGFIHSSLIAKPDMKQREQKAALIVVTNCPVEFSSNFESIEMTEAWTKGQRAWQINFDESWSDIEKWRHEFKPLQ